MNTKNPTLMSLFTGSGGLDEGFKAAGCNIKACLELESWACDTLRENNSHTHIIQGDIKKIPPQMFAELTNIQPNEIDIIAGCPPCQPFSVAASQRFLKTQDTFKRKGFEDDEKGNLLYDLIAYIKWFKPKVFIIENVSGLLTMDKGENINKCLSELRELGYSHTEPKTLNAVDYGVPQFRERCIIWGVLSSNMQPKLPAVTHFKDKEPYWRTVSQALVDVNSELANHIIREHQQESVNRYKVLEFGQRDKKGRVDRLDPNLPSKTIIAGGLKGGGRSHLHPFIPRTMSVRECARLQTFSDNFTFAGSVARQFTQVGNAVPPLLAEHLAREILTTVFNINFDGILEHEKKFVAYDNNYEKSTCYLLKQSLSASNETYHANK